MYFFWYVTTFISRISHQQSILLFKWIPHFRLIDVYFIYLTNIKNICLHRTLKQQYLYYKKEIYHFKFLITKNKNFDNKVKKTLKKMLKSSISPHLKITWKTLRPDKIVWKGWYLKTNISFSREVYFFYIQNIVFFPPSHISSRIDGYIPPSPSE